MAHKIVICICLCVVIGYVLSQIPDSTICPYNWAEFDGICYLFKTSATSWTTALDECRKEGAVLAMIDTHKKLEFLSRTMRIMSWNGAVFELWFGLSDEVYEGQWRWVKTGQNAVQTFWTSDGTHYAKDNCAYIDFRTQGQTFWDKGNCNARKNYVCEKDGVFPSHKG